MKWVSLFVFLSLVCMMFFSGCTSPSTNQVKINGINETQTRVVSTPNFPAANESVSVVTLALFPQDLPKGSSITHNDWLNPDLNCTGDTLCMKEGYSVTVDNGKNTTVEQNVMIYSKPVTNGTLEQVLNEGYPEYSTYIINELPTPGIGEVSRIWKYIAPNDIAPGLQGYFIVFGKGNVYEIFHISGKNPDLVAGKELASAAAQKIKGFQT